MLTVPPMALTASELDSLFNIPPGTIEAYIKAGICPEESFTWYPKSNQPRWGQLGYEEWAQILYNDGWLPEVVPEPSYEWGIELYADN